MGSLSWPVTLGSIADTVRTVYRCLHLYRDAHSTNVPRVAAFSRVFLAARSGDDDDHEDETPPAPLTATAGGLKTACELAGVLFFLTFSG